MFGFGSFTLSFSFILSFVIFFLFCVYIFCVTNLFRSLVKFISVNYMSNLNLILSHFIHSFVNFISFVFYSVYLAPTFIRSSFSLLFSISHSRFAFRCDASFSSPSPAPSGNAGLLSLPSLMLLLFQIIINHLQLCLPCFTLPLSYSHCFSSPISLLFSSPSFAYFAFPSQLPLLSHPIPSPHSFFFPLSLLPLSPSSLFPTFPPPSL